MYIFLFSNRFPYSADVKLTVNKNVGFRTIGQEQILGFNFIIGHVQFDKQLYSVCNVLKFDILPNF